MSTTPNNENAIYESFRRVLKNLRASSNSRDSRTGERKQIALKQTADRYKVRVRDVKAIVRKLDAENGITREQPEEYKKSHAFKVAHENFVDNYSGTPACVVCNVTDEKDVRARLRDFLYPYEYESILRVFPESVIDETKNRNYLEADPSEWVFDMICFTCRLQSYHRFLVQPSY